MTWEEIKMFTEEMLADFWEVDSYTNKTISLRRPERLGERRHKDGHYWRLLAYNGTKPEMTIWGPDGLILTPIPPVYSMDALHALTRRCQFCGAQDVSTQRVGFAARSCSSCLPAARKELEKPGWAD